MTVGTVPVYEHLSSKNHAETQGPSRPGSLGFKRHCSQPIWPCEDIYWKFTSLLRVALAPVESGHDGYDGYDLCRTRYATSCRGGSRFDDARGSSVLVTGTKAFANPHRGKSRVGRLLQCLWRVLSWPAMCHPAWDGVVRTPRHGAKFGTVANQCIKNSSFSSSSSWCPCAMVPSMARWSAAFDTGFDSGTSFCFERGQAIQDTDSVHQKIPWWVSIRRGSSLIEGWERFSLCCCSYALWILEGAYIARSQCT